MTLEEEAITFAFGGICVVKSFKWDWEKAWKLYEFLRNLKNFWSSDADLIERDEQSSELTDETPGSFIDLPTAEIRGAYLELKSSWHMAPRRIAFQTTSASRIIQRNHCILSKQSSRSKASNTTSAFHESHVSNKLNVRLTFRSTQHAIMHFKVKTRVAFSTERPASSSIKAASSLASTRVFPRFCNLFNSTPEK